MQTEQVMLKNGEATGVVIPAGPVSIVAVIAAEGMVGCGAFDVEALGRFGYAAAAARAVSGPSITTVADLLAGEIVRVNGTARSRGVREGMSGKEALDLLS
ncbi:MAG: DUF1805 domain-containing protein [Methanomicrobiales archaeon]|nr:DUF1805 domain-containing protein [Methanomicrobiales archaeon]